MKIFSLIFALALLVNSATAAPFPTPTATPVVAATPAPVVSHKLTARQHKLAIAAQVELQAAIDGQTAARNEANQAKQAAADSDASAKATEARAVTAEKQAADEHNALVGCAARVAKDEAIVKQVNSYWGLGGILYGIGRLVKHLLITIIVVVVLAVGFSIASIFFPWIGVAFKAVLALIRPAFSSVSRIIGGLWRRKPKLVLPAAS